VGRRFGNIKQAPKLQQAYTAYKSWQDTVKPYKERSSGSKPGGLVYVQIRPFGADGTDLVKVKVSRRAHTAVGGDVGTRAAAATSTAVLKPGLEPAKIVVFRGTGTTTQARSEITNLEYQRRNGSSYTHAFGGSTATEKEFEAQDALITIFATTQGTSVSFQPERLRKN
jgi:hypothetical protein